MAAGGLDGMADQAVFPLNEVTDDAAGLGVVSATGRERFVVTDAKSTAGDQTTTMRYGDLLIRTSEGWRFQTMVAGGWSETL